MRILQLHIIVAVVGTSVPVCLAQDANSFKTLYSFAGQPDGANPRAGVVIGKNGALYGTTSSGGTSNYGAVFKFVPPSSPGGAWTETALYSFMGGTSDGANPSVPVAIGSGGVLYSTAAAAFSMVFSLTPPAFPGGAWTETVLWPFSRAYIGPDYSSGVAIGSGGVLYSVQSSSPCSVALLAFPCAQVFELKPPTSPGGNWTKTVLYTFIPYDTNHTPSATVVIGKNGVLYGTLETLSRFTVFALTPSGGSWTETELYGSSYPDSNSHVAPVVIGQSGALYGTTEYLGTGSCGCGTVYSVAPPASPGGVWTETVLWSFMAGSDGALPQAGLAIGSGGVLYGTTSRGGGGSNAGTVFSLIPPAPVGGAWTERVLHRFTGGSDGASPLGGLVIGKNGVLYGTTSSGGASNAGTVFALEP